LAKLRKKYCRLDPERAAGELSVIFSLHTAFDMLPDKVISSGNTGEVFSCAEEKTYMEKILDPVFFSRNILPGFSFDEILWKIPYVLLGYLFVRESRKAGVKGIGRMQTSERLWELFSRHMADTVKNRAEEKTYMEKIWDPVFFSRNILPGFSFDEILWKIPYVFLGYLFVRESRKAGVKGIGRMQTSERLWELFSRHMADTVKNKEEENGERR
jgi:hypothetical protein